MGAPPVPLPADAHAAADAAANVRASALICRFMISSIAARGAVLLDGFYDECDSLTATDAGCAESVSLTPGTQRMQ